MISFRKPQFIQILQTGSRCFPSYTNISAICVYIFLSITFSLIYGCTQKINRKDVFVPIPEVNGINGKIEDFELHFVDGDNVSYPVTFKFGEKPGEGVLFPLFNLAFKEARDKHNFNFEKESINIVVSINGESEYNSVVMKEAKKFIASKKGFFFIPSKESIKRQAQIIKENRATNIPKVIKVNDPKEFDMIIFMDFTSNLEMDLSIIADNGETLFFKPGIDFSGLKAGTLEKWVTLSVPRYKTSVKDRFEIMRTTVSEEEFLAGSSGSAKLSKINIDVSSADKYCFERESGATVSSIYIFEFARRKGIISYPFVPATEEIISGFDEEMGDDLYMRPGDKVRSKDFSGSQAVIEAIMFDWERGKYYFVSTAHKSANTAFRCVRRIE